MEGNSNLPFDLLFEHRGTSGHTEMIFVWHDLTRIASTSCLKYIRHIQYGRRVTRVNWGIYETCDCEAVTTRGCHLGYTDTLMHGPLGSS